MSTEPPPLYLGFDLSTQQLKAIVVSSDLHVVSEAKVDFDADFGAKYGITKGVLTDEAEGEVFAPVAMWLEAVDLVLRRLRDTGCPLARVRGISGSCQQHGSVFWSAEGERALQALNTEGSATDDDDDDGLLARLRGAFAYQYGPNWQDHSTQAECDLFDAHLGGAHKLAEVTGSAAHHRFTGPQIMRMRRKRPEVYEKTARISLVSSFLASVFLGKTAPIDIGDVTGMNLWDMKAQAWSEPLLELAAGSAEGVAALRRKLGDVPLDGGGSLGGVARYFADRYGFRSDGYCRVAPFTGDNPATILALPLRPLDAIVSLGTSTTFLMVTPTYRPDPSYHFMNHPASPGHYMFMLCYKNGGLAREKVRDALPAATTAPKDGGGDPWAAFNAQVLATPPLDVRDPAVDRAKIGLYFPLPEIVPNVRAGTWRYTCRATDGGDLREADWDAATDARAIVESQALSMRLRSHNLVSPPPPPPAAATPGAGSQQQLPAQPRRIYLVGGGSLNPAIARVVGDVLGGADGVYKLDVGGNACALGGAYKAVWALEREQRGDGDYESFDELIGRRWKEEGAIEKADQGYRPGVFERYGGGVLAAFEEMEKRILEVAHN